MNSTNKSSFPRTNLQAAIAAEKPLQVVGAINAYAARMAQATGFRALYLSGGGVAREFTRADPSISTMDDVYRHPPHHRDWLLPLLVDTDTGWRCFQHRAPVEIVHQGGRSEPCTSDQVQSSVAATGRTEVVPAPKWWIASNGGRTPISNSSSWRAAMRRAQG
jgi:methylisocitrate lyase